ncbi:MAG: hypothetical protein ACKO40_12815 [Planctomycetaceae bacterium]
MNRTVVICGVPPVRSIGAGRLAIELARQSAGRPDVRLVFAGNRSAVADAVRRNRYAAAARALIVHAGRRMRQRILAAGSGGFPTGAVGLLYPKSIRGHR